jgi:hypothetical protein
MERSSEAGDLGAIRHGMPELENQFVALREAIETERCPRAS